MAQLEAMGCQVRWDARRAAACSRGYLAGDDTMRRDELCAALEEPDVEIVWCARGGSGMNRIIEPVLEHARRLPPRCLIGFSDITALLNVLSLQLRWITFHGPVVTSLGRTEPTSDLERILATLQGQFTDVRFTPHRGRPVSARLLGGNLTVLASMVGDQLTTHAGEELIWLLEDVGEAPYRLDRAFTQLRNSGALGTPRALWFGDLDLPETQQERTIAALGRDAQVPTLHNAPAGHRGPLALLPIGAQVHLDPEQGRLWTNEPWVMTNEC